MAAPPPLDRRRLLAGAGAAAAVLALRPWRTFVAVPVAAPRERLAALLAPHDGVRRVGAAYLRAHPEDADPARLVEALSVVLDLTSDDLRAHAAATVRGELRSGDVVRLDGWIASPTEARLAALVTLVT